MMLVWIVHTFLWAIVSICAYSLMMRVTWAVGDPIHRLHGDDEPLRHHGSVGADFCERYNYQTIFYICRARDFRGAGCLVH